MRQIRAKEGGSSCSREFFCCSHVSSCNYVGGRGTGSVLESLWSRRIPQEKNKTDQKWYTYVCILAEDSPAKNSRGASGSQRAYIRNRFMLVHTSQDSHATQETQSMYPSEDVFVSPAFHVFESVLERGTLISCCTCLERPTIFYIIILTASVVSSTNSGSMRILCNLRNTPVTRFW